MKIEIKRKEQLADQDVLFAAVAADDHRRWKRAKKAGMKVLSRAYDMWKERRDQLQRRLRP